MTAVTNAAAGGPRDAIFTWHGVVPRLLAGVDAYAVTQATFLAHLDLIGDAFEVVPLRELAAARSTPRQGGRPRAALTFDDALRCQAEFALPHLRRRRWPFTVCTPTEAVDAGTPLRALVLRYCVMTTAAARLDLGWTSFRLAGSHSDRAALAEELSDLVLAAEAPCRESMLDSAFRQCRDVYEAALTHSAFLPMGWDEIGEALRSGGTIASHSRSHSPLPRLRADALERELTDSKRVIEARAGRACDVFCFPYGLYDQASVAAVRKAGYAWMLTSCGAAAECIAGDMLPRIDARTLPPAR